MSKRCITYQEPKNPAANGPLKYGYQDQTHTQVWEGQDEPPPARQISLSVVSPSKPISASVIFDLADGGRTYRVALALLSSFSPGVYKYEVAKLSDETGPFRFDWSSASRTAFIAEVKRLKLGEPPFRLLDLKKSMTFQVRSQNDPMLGTGQVEIYDPTGKVAAAADVPAWVPRPPT